MAKLNGSFENLKHFGGNTIAAIVDLCKKSNDPPISFSENKSHSCLLSIYGISVRIRVSLFSDCEETHEGKIEIHRKGTEPDESEWVEMRIVDEPKGLDQIVIQTGASVPWDAAGVAYDQGNKGYHNASQLASFIFNRLPTAIAKAKIRIPLDE